LLGCLARAKAAALLLGLHKVVFETDATLLDATLLNIAVEGEDYRLSAMGGIITEIKLALSEFVMSSMQVCPFF